MRCTGVVPVVGLAALGLLAGCTSSGPAQQSPPGTSAAPVSASPTTSTPSSSASTSSAPPLSSFESDPGVKAYRSWAAQAAHTINTGHYTSTSLQHLMTSSFAKTMKHVLGTEVGRYYPGPIPFRPTEVVSPSAATKEISGCLIAEGFAENPKTKKPAQARQVLPVVVSVVYSNGHWLMNNLNPSKTSCSGVKIGTPQW